MIMSVELYSRVLWWDGATRRGLAKNGDIRVDLHAPPSVLDHPSFIDYGEIRAGEATYTQLKTEPGGRTREMEAPEIEAIRKWFAGAGFMRLLRRCIVQSRKMVKP